MKVSLTNNDSWRIQNALRVAQEKYTSNAKDMRELEARGGTNFITAAGAKNLAETFDLQARQTLEDMNLFAALRLPCELDIDEEELAELDAKHPALAHSHNHVREEACADGE